MLIEYTTYTYRLRCGAPMSITGGTFVLHTFMAEKTQIDMELCATSLPSSSDFRGQGGTLMSANFSRMKNEPGGRFFQGQKVHIPEYVEEGSY